MALSRRQEHVRPWLSVTHTVTLLVGTNARRDAHVIVFKGPCHSLQVKRSATVLSNCYHYFELGMCRSHSAAEAYTTEYLTFSEGPVDIGRVQHLPASSPPSRPTVFLGGRAVLQPLDDNVRVAEPPERPRGRPSGQRPAPVWQCACGARASVRTGSDDESRVCWDCFTAILD